MIDTEATALIEAPVERVFSYLDRPANQPEITPSLVRSEPVEELPDGGKRVAHTYALAGLTFEGHVTAVEYEPERHVRWEMTGDLEGEIEWTFEPEGEATRVTYAIRYALPVPILGGLLEPLVERYNRRELETTLANLRAELGDASG